MSKKSEFIEKLLGKMTVREKVGQLNQCGNSIYNDDYKIGWDLLREGRIGSFLGICNPEKVNEMQKVAVEETRLGIPLLLGYDVIHGFKTTFPVPWSECFSWEPALAKKTSEVSAKEAAANGVNWIYAPMIDVARDSRWGRGVEGSGEDTYLACEFAKARVEGIQGKNLSDGEHALACAKHFVGYGACIGGRDYNSADMSEQTLFDVYIPPFKAAIDAGAKTIMSGFHDLNGEPCTGSKYILTDILRDKLKFSGTVISDAGSCDQIKIHGYTESDRDTAKTAINAGLDVEMCFGIFTYQDNLEELVESGEVSMETLDRSVRRVLELKYDLGLFENPYKDIEKAKAVILTEENRKIAYEAALRSMVLLTNNGILPIDKSKKVCIEGSFASNGDEMLGTWAGEGEPGDAITPKMAFEPYYDENSDIVIAFIGEPHSMNGEGKSRTRNTVPKEHIELLKNIKAKGKKLVTVVIGGRPLVLTEICELSDAVIFSGALGIEAGNAYRDVIFGNYNPSGKLVNTFPTAVGQTPLYYNMKNTGKPPVEEFFWTSKYIDVPIKPLFPFGFGLSYTEFDYSNISVSDSEPNKTDTITVSADVKNIGKVDGEEIVQLYVRDVCATQTRPIKELKGFEKIKLCAGETKTVEFKLNISDLGFHNRSLEYVVESGRFKIMVGKNSDEFIETEICVK